MIEVIAIITGPIAAVLITRFFDARRERRNARLKVFRDLMATRGIRIDPMHVAALNLVEVEFYHDKAVRASFRTYIDHLSAPMPPEEEQGKFFEQRNDLLLNMLSAIGGALGMPFDKRDLERLTYVPKGWDADQTLQRRNAFLVSRVLSGEAPLKITNFVGQGSPFPEPPQDD